MERIYVIYPSGNQALYVVETLLKQRIEVQLVSTPCIIAKEGCSYAVLTNPKDLPHVIQTSTNLKINIREVYRAENLFNKQKFEKVERWDKLTNM